MVPGLLGKGKKKMSNAQRELISFHEIHKWFGGVYAVKGVSFSLRQGEIHGLVGENGAGKSTLIKICGGIYKPDSGRIIFDGETVSFRNPRHSEELGIRIVHQEVPICLNLTVAENIFLDPFPPSRGVFVDRKFMNRKSSEILQRLGIDLNPKQPAYLCSPAQQQLILIAKALAQRVKLVIMDEPTSSLSEAEVEILFSVIRRLQQEGGTFMFVSHRLHEVIDICTRVTVMKNGEYVDTLDNEQRDVSVDLLTQKIVGKEVMKVTPLKEHRVKPGKVVLEVRNLSQARAGLKNINFQLRQGEVLGLAGLRGAGRTELMRCIFGLDRPDTGEILLDGKPISLQKPIHAIRNGIGFLTENRGESLYYAHSVRANIASVIIDRLQRFGLIKGKDYSNLARKYKEELRIDSPSVQTELFNLSGGNQQKVVLGRWLAANPRVFFLDEPTRGIDVGVKVEIRHKIRDLVATGISVIFISLDLDELLMISDRILIMRRGYIAKELSSKEMTRANIIKDISNHGKTGDQAIR